MAWPSHGMALHAMEGTGLMPEALAKIRQDTVAQRRKVVIGKI